MVLVSKDDMYLCQHEQKILAKQNACHCTGWGFPGHWYHKKSPAWSPFESNQVWLPERSHSTVLLNFAPPCGPSTKHIGLQAGAQGIESTRIHHVFPGSSKGRHCKCNLHFSFVRNQNEKLMLRLQWSAKARERMSNRDTTRLTSSNYMPNARPGFFPIIVRRNGVTIPPLPHDKNSSWVANTSLPTSCTHCSASRSQRSSTSP